MGNDILARARRLASGAGRGFVRFAKASDDAGTTDTRTELNLDSEPTQHGSRAAYGSSSHFNSVLLQPLACVTFPAVSLLEALTGTGTRLFLGGESRRKKNKLEAAAMPQTRCFVWRYVVAELLMVAELIADQLVDTAGLIYGCIA